MIQIDKISKYVVVGGMNKDNHNSTTRRMLLSLPRVRWLERNGGNQVSGYLPIAGEERAEGENELEVEDTI